ncbi:hypothetical protein DL96DRAFT_45203 [Flagelloscypha sp. PMI_526]|nr:hypothetical protein DL96DRAFT_45203 [Flagelloscypha sp. PMI_526]
MGSRRRPLTKSILDIWAVMAATKKVIGSHHPTSRPTFMAPSKRSVAIRELLDGQPLTRRHLQSKLLDCILDPHGPVVFTNPFKSQELPGDKISFKDLYITSLYRSTKATKVLKDTMTDSGQFAVDFAKLCLATNVGRITTSMSFFPGMKTAIRLYHPVPCLQTTQGNLQDAPRIRHILKGCHVPADNGEDLPSALEEVTARRDQNKFPSTSAVNLIFILSSPKLSIPNLNPTVTESITFSELFTPRQFTSSSRAQLFLWLMYQFLELTPGGLNPFTHPDYPDCSPPLVPMDARSAELENEETEEDKEVLQKLLTQRNDMIRMQARQVTTGKSQAKLDEVEGHVSTPKKGSRNLSKPGAQHSLNGVKSEDGDSSLHTIKHRHSASPIVPASSLNRFSPYPKVSPTPSDMNMLDLAIFPSPKDSKMLRYAWRSISTSDPLGDSDDETYEDTRMEYAHRYQIINRLRARSSAPTLSGL